jgi:hypothetical protein
VRRVVLLLEEMILLRAGAWPGEQNVVFKEVHQVQALGPLKEVGFIKLMKT